MEQRAEDIRQGKRARIAKEEWKRTPSQEYVAYICQLDEGGREDGGQQGADHFSGALSAGSCG